MNSRRDELFKILIAFHPASCHDGSAIEILKRPAPMKTAAQKTIT